MAVVDASPPSPSTGEATRARPTGRSRHPWPRWTGPVLLAVVVVVALIIGSGVGRSHQTPTQRAQAIEAQIRCPSCEDLSVLDSSASTAVTVRHQIAQMVDEGQSTAAIEHQLVLRYGPTILLRPPTSGLTALVWIIPVIAGVAAITCLIVLFWRRARAMDALRRDGPA